MWSSRRPDLRRHIEWWKMKESEKRSRGQPRWSSHGQEQMVHKQSTKLSDRHLSILNSFCFFNKFVGNCSILITWSNNFIKIILIHSEIYNLRLIHNLWLRFDLQLQTDFTFLRGEKYQWYFILSLAFFPLSFISPLKKEEEEKIK